MTATSWNGGLMTLYEERALRTLPLPVYHSPVEAVVSSTAMNLGGMETSTANTSGVWNPL